MERTGQTQKSNGIFIAENYHRKQGVPVGSAAKQVPHVARRHRRLHAQVHDEALRQGDKTLSTLDIGYKTTTLLFVRNVFL